MNPWKPLFRNAALVVGIVALSAVGHSPGLAQANQTLSLEAALKSLPNSLDWHQADLTYQSFEKNLEAARAAAGLKVSAGGDTSLSFPSSGSGSQTLNLSATASLTVLPWSSAYDGIRSAERALTRAQFDRDDTRSTLALNVFNQYNTARISGSDLVLAQANFKLSQASLKVATAQQANGQISKDALNTVQKNLETSQLNLEQATNTLEINRLTLFNTLNLEPSEVIFSSIPTERPLIAGDLDELTKKALTKRSDLQKALSKLSDAQDSLASAQRDRLLPTASVNLGVAQSGAASLSSGLNLQTGSLSLTGTVPVVNNNASTSTGSTTTGTNLTLSASLSIPIVAPAGDVKTSSAEVSLAAAKKSLEQTRQTAILDVRQKYGDAKLAVGKLNLAKSSLKAANASDQTAKARFSAGLSTPNELEQSRIGVQQALRDLDQAVVNEVLATYRLEGALGITTVFTGGTL
jgi:outer membrane protein